MDDLGLIPDLDQDSIAPPIIHVFFIDSQGLRVPGRIGAESFGGTGALTLLLLILLQIYSLQLHRVWFSGKKCLLAIYAMKTH